MIRVLQREPLDIAAEMATLRRAGDVGALVSFTGPCPQGVAGQPNPSLTLDHYPAPAHA